MFKVNETTMAWLIDVAKAFNGWVNMFEITPEGKITGTVSGWVRMGMYLDKAHDHYRGLMAVETRPLEKARLEALRVQLANACMFALREGDKVRFNHS